MANLKTTYLGIPLKNPLVLGASNLSLDTDKVRKLADAGVAAVVFKSLFEEQIQLESLQMEEDLTEYSERHAEMTSLFPSLRHAGPEEHLEQLRQLKEAVDIPVIGSLNCVQAETWSEYAVMMAQTGVDALELNFYALPGMNELPAAETEAAQLEVLKEVKSKVKLPIAVKLSPYYTNPLAFIRQLDGAGVNGLVLFNRLFQPDIDLEQQAHVYPFHLSQEGEYRLPLRFAGLLYDQVKADICSSGGIFHGEDVLRLLLAGAGCVQVVSAVYKHKASRIGSMLADMEAWMDQKGYADLEALRGRLSMARLQEPYAYKRAQYVDLLMKPFDLMKKYPRI